MGDDKDDDSRDLDDSQELDTEDVNHVRVSLLDLSYRQRRTIGAALTLLAALVICWILFKVFVGAIHFLGVFSGVFLPLATAFIMALVLKPFYEWLHRGRPSINETMAVAIIYLSFLLPLVLALFFFGKVLVGEAGNLLQQAPRAAQQVKQFSKEQLDHWDRAGLERNLVDVARALDRAGQTNEVVVVEDLISNLQIHPDSSNIVSNVEAKAEMLRARVDKAVLQEFPELSDSLELLGHRLDDETLWEQYGIGPRLEQVIQSKGDELAGMLTSFMGGVFAVSRGAVSRMTGMFGWFVLPVYLAFFLQMRPIPRDKRHEWFSFLKGETQRDVVYLIDQFVDIMVSFFRGQLVIALIQGLLFGIGFKLVGLHYGFAIGFSLGLLNIIPYLGSMIGLGVALPIAFLQGPTWYGLEGGWLLLGLVVGVFAIVQMIEGYVLTPRIMGDRTGLHPMAIIVAIFFWGTAFEGIIGMLLAIPLTAFLVVFWRLFKRKDLLTEWF